MSDTAHSSANPNSTEAWNALWAREGVESWRGTKLAPVYTRICELMPRKAQIVDVGGGAGILARRLCEDSPERQVTVWEHSPVAVEFCRQGGIAAKVVDLEKSGYPCIEGLEPVVVATEVLEHLTDTALDRVLRISALAGHAIFSVPNNCLPPEVEPQHKRMWNALGFKQHLERYFGRGKVRVECVDDVLIGICGWQKQFTMSVCFPARDEADDIERVLKSFRGVADEMVVGVDPRSKDRTEEIARLYAETVFFLEQPEGSEEQRKEWNIPDNGVHFANIRNQCMDRCTSDWIFMTEAHEHLHSGHDHLLHLDRVPAYVPIIMVMRTDVGQRWAWPWLCRNNPAWRYKRGTHNVLDFDPEKVPVQSMSKVLTRHVRSEKNALARSKQRRAQNRISLLEDWLRHGNENSLYYYASELREIQKWPNRAIERLEQLLAMPRRNGPLRYQARLVLARELVHKAEEHLSGPPNETDEQRGQRAIRFHEWCDKAREVLLQCPVEDWSRSEHWMYLGDIAFARDRHEEALQWYRCLGASMGDVPWSMWWVDEFAYSIYPAQRLAMTYAALGRIRESLEWARRVPEQIPEEISDGEAKAILEEAERNIARLEDALERTKAKE